MRIFLSVNEPEDKSYKWANSLPMLDGIVLNSEATNIVCKNFLSSFSFEEIGLLIQKIILKMRIGCELSIIDIDSDLLSRSLHVEEIGLSEANNSLFSEQKRKSIFNMDYIKSILPSNLEITNIHYDNGKSQFVMKCRRKN